MKTNFITLLLTTILISSCVSPKVYKDLENKYADLKKQNTELSDELEALRNQSNTTNSEYEALKSEYEDVVDTRDNINNSCWCFG